MKENPTTIDLSRQYGVEHCMHWKENKCDVRYHCPGHECYDYTPRITQSSDGWYPHRK